jgi:hypothetical protein
VSNVNTRGKKIILLLLVLVIGQSPLARAQPVVNPTADQLMQIMRSQAGVNIAAPVTATASFDPPQVRPGEKAVYRVVFNATAVSVHWPEKIPAEIHDAGIHGASLWSIRAHSRRATRSENGFARAARARAATARRTVHDQCFRR